MMVLLAQVRVPPVVMGAKEWFLVVLANVIIFAIIGPKLLRDIRGKG